MRETFIFFFFAICLTSCNIRTKQLEKMPSNFEANNELPDLKIINNTFTYSGLDDEVNMDYIINLVDYDDYYGFKVIDYGKYDNNILRWIVLDEIDNKLLLLSKDVLNIDLTLYNDNHKNFSDENNISITSYISNILNEIYEHADINTDYLYEVQFDKYDNVIFDSEHGEKLFCLSENEIEKYFGTVDKNRMNKYSVAECNNNKDNLYRLKTNSWFKNNVPYYLRDKTDEGKFNKWVGVYGNIYNDDMYIINYDKIGIRPAMYINKTEAFKYLSEFYKNDEKITNSIIHILGDNYGTNAQGKICRDSICVSDNADFYLTDSEGKIIFNESRDNLIEKDFGNGIKGKIYLYDKGKVAGSIGDTLITNIIEQETDDTLTSFPNIDIKPGIFDKYNYMILPYMNGRFTSFWKNAFYDVGNYIENPYNINANDDNNVFLIDDYGYLTDSNGKIIRIKNDTPCYQDFDAYDIYTKKIVKKKRYYVNSKKFYCYCKQKIDGKDKYFDENGFVIMNDVYKFRNNSEYLFINSDGIPSTVSETIKVNNRIYDIYAGKVFHDGFYFCNLDGNSECFYYYNSDGVRVTNERIADKWVADKNGKIEGVNSNNYRKCNNYLNFYEAMYPGKSKKAKNMKTKLLDLLKYTNIYKKEITKKIIDKLEENKQDIKPLTIGNYDTIVDAKEQGFYKNVWKVNGEIIKNSIIYVSNNIYGTDNKGQILINGLCKGKDGLTYATDEDGKVIFDKSYGAFVGKEQKYYYDNKGNIFTGDELVLEKFGIRILFNKNHTIKDVSNIYEFERDKVTGKLHIIGLNNGEDFVVRDWYKGYQIDKDGYVIEQSDSGYFDFDGKKKFYSKTDKHSYYCANWEYSSRVFFDENGFLLKNGIYQYGKYFYLTDENGLQLSIDGDIKNGKLVDLDEGTAYVYSAGVIAGRFIFTDSGDVYYADDNGYIVKDCWLTDRLYFDKNGKLQTKNVTENNARGFEKWIKFYEIMY